MGWGGVGTEVTCGCRTSDWALTAVRNADSTQSDVRFFFFFSRLTTSKILTVCMSPALILAPLFGTLADGLQQPAWQGPLLVTFQENGHVNLLWKKKTGLSFHSMVC